MFFFRYAMIVTSTETRNAYAAAVHYAQARQFSVQSALSILFLCRRGRSPGTGFLWHDVRGYSGRHSETDSGLCGGQLHHCLSGRRADAGGAGLFPQSHGAGTEMERQWCRHPSFHSDQRYGAGSGMGGIFQRTPLSCGAVTGREPESPRCQPFRPHGSGNLWPGHGVAEPAEGIQSGIQCADGGHPPDRAPDQTDLSVFLKARRGIPAVYPLSGPAGSGAGKAGLFS